MTSPINLNPSISLLLLAVLLYSLCGCIAEPKATTNDDARDVTYYSERHRPQFHFTPEANWMNDPNGMFYYKGQYHLFYQYYPDSTVWGPMHWGHATSQDLVRWEHQDIGLYPDSIGCIFSGGAVVDTDNTSGLGSAEQPPIVATFTHHDFKGERAKTNNFQKQSIAYSTDGGHQWTKFKGNPVIPNTEKIKDFRDPKVVWHAASDRWVLVLAAYDRVKFYASTNLIDWEHISDFGIEGDHRLWECPDLVSMQVEGSEEIKWVLIVSIQKDAPNGGTATSYFVGDFNGNQFVANTADQQWLDWGTDNYAFVTWSNIPEVDGRTLGIGWMSNWQYAQIVPTDKWRSAMTVPRELQLVRRGKQYRIRSQPVRELKVLRGEPITFADLSVDESRSLDETLDGSQVEINLTIDMAATDAQSYGLVLANDAEENVRITFDVKTSEMIVDRRNSRKDKFSESFFNGPLRAPVELQQEQMKVRLLIDVASIEIFIDEGDICFTSIFFPSQDFNHLSLFAKDGQCQIDTLSVHPLASIWQ